MTVEKNVQDSRWRVWIRSRGPRRGSRAARACAASTTSSSGHADHTSALHYIASGTAVVLWGDGVHRAGFDGLAEERRDGWDRVGQGCPRTAGTADLSAHRVGCKAIDIGEPFPVRTPQATLVYAEPLTLRSRVPDAASFSPTEWKPTSCVFMRAWRPSLASPKSQADSWCEAPFCLY